MKVLPIKKSETYDWLKNKHYAKRVPPIAFAFGLYEEHVLVGVCTYGTPCRMLNDGFGLFGDTLKVKTLELNRLVINEGMVRNTLSCFVSQTLKHLPHPSAIVSYADSNNGHHGYIYQATNWLYTGITGSEKYYYDERKKVIVHGRTIFSEFGTRSFNKLPAFIKEAGKESGKYRYLMFLGSKREKKKMNRLLKYPTLSYPKGNNTRYDASYKPTTQGLLV